MSDIPQVNFYGHSLTRFMLGDNPFNGHSYIQDVHSGNEMLDYYTADNVLRAMFEAEELGVNAYVALADPFVLRLLRQYRNEGGKMKIIFQSYPPIDLQVNVNQMMACEPIGIYHQGGTLDLLVEEDKIEELRRRLEWIRAAGVKTGLGTHVPEVLLRSEAENWGVDFYMACLYNARRTQRGQQSGFITGKPKELVFYPGDPPMMYEAVRKVQKPCIVFKLFAGGQVFTGKRPEDIPGLIDGIYAEVFENIKPEDTVCVGVFQKFKDQLKENVGIAKTVLNGK